MYGLTDGEWQRLRAVFADYPEIDRAILYGSRVKGTYKPYSDIDITLYAEGMTDGRYTELLADIDDLLLPYRVDLSLFHRLKNEQLIDHIHRRGVEVFAMKCLR